VAGGGEVGGCEEGAVGGQHACGSARSSQSAVKNQHKERRCVARECTAARHRAVTVLRNVHGKGWQWQAEATENCVKVAWKVHALPWDPHALPLPAVAAWQR